MMNPLKIGSLAIPVPIIQCGMGVGISLSGLAVAVANAKYLEPAIRIKKEIQNKLV